MDENDDKNDNKNAFKCMVIANSDKNSTCSK